MKKIHHHVIQRLFLCLVQLITYNSIIRFYSLLYLGWYFILQNWIRIHLLINHFLRVYEKFCISLIKSIDRLHDIKMCFVIFVTIVVIRSEHQRWIPQSIILHTHPRCQSVYLHQEPYNIEQVLDFNHATDLIINCFKFKTWNYFICYASLPYMNNFFVRI